MLVPLLDDSLQIIEEEIRRLKPASSDESGLLAKSGDADVAVPLKSVHIRASLMGAFRHELCAHDMLVLSTHCSSLQT